MKILAIRLKNLASMEGETEIDFTQEPLCSAGIYAITGPTGAGKSTILDALCLALYAKTPRYTQGKEPGIEVKELNQGDVRAILRNGSGDGFAEVDFVGIDDNKYRARWGVKRARNKPEGPIQKETLTLLNINSGLVICTLKTEACKEIERLVGLSFEQFTRSVLLAQGDFTAFLKADNNDKASLLEKLTGTSIYSKISQQVFNNYKIAQSAIDQLKAQLDVVEILSNEDIESEKSRQQEINAVLNEIIRQLDTLQKDILWQEKMIQLNRQKESSLAALEAARQRKLDASDRFTRLRMVQEVQKIRSSYELHQSLNEQYHSDKNKLEQTRIELKELQDSADPIDQTFSCLSTKLSATRETATKALPLLNEARRLDVQISEQQKNMLFAKQVWAEARDKCNQKEARLAATVTQLASAEQDITTLQEWKRKNADREPIANNIVLIRTRLEEASRQLADASNLSNAIQSKQAQVRHTEKIVSALRADLESTRIVFNKLNVETETLQKKLIDFNIQSLENSNKEYSLLLNNLVPAGAAWRMLYEKQGILQATKNSIAELIEQRRNAELRLQTIEQLLPRAIEKKNASDQRLTRARIEVSENVESLRTQLRNDEPCPVCGSTEHPYTQHHPQVANLLKLLEKESRDDFAEWNSLQNDIHSLTESGKRLAAELQQTETNLQVTTTQVHQLETEWKRFTIGMPALVDAEKNSWLESRIAQCKADQLKISEKISEYVSLESKWKEKQVELLDVEKKLTQISNELQIESGNLQTYTLRATELSAELQHKETEYSNLLNGLNIYFTQSSWQSNWKEAPAQFIQKLERFATEWNNKLTLLDKTERGTQLVENSVMQFTGEVKEQRLELENRKQEYDRSIALHNEIALKRKALFDGRLTTDVESELQNDIEHAAKELEKTRTSKHDVAEKIAVSNSVIEQLMILIQKKENNLTELLGKINEWINTFNNSNERSLHLDYLKGLFSLSHDWIEEEQRSLLSIERSVIEAKANLRERDNDIQHHAEIGKPSAELDVLIKTQQELQSDKKTHEDSLAHIGYRFNADASNKRKAGKIISEIEAASIKAENWARLNEMIGSADGKKFRQAAQEYTLDVLLVFANAQLTGLSKRYEMRRIENTLGLLVVDKDMGDEERTVVSLSGGESFLVSLALALGLASLSSSRMKVESLFIDEGFGSLDPATLNIAMDALEKLHNQGRKVGVISHVREMQERISTQIKVVKQSTGRSIVTIENGLN